MRAHRWKELAWLAVVAVLVAFGAIHYRTVGAPLPIDVTEAQLRAVTFQIFDVQCGNDTTYGLPLELSKWTREPYVGFTAWSPPPRVWCPGGLMSGTGSPVQAALTSALKPVMQRCRTLQYNQDCLQLYSWWQRVDTMLVSVDVLGIWYDPNSNQFRAIQPPMVVYKICDRPNARGIGGTDVPAAGFDSFATQFQVPKLNEIVDGQMAAQTTYMAVANQMLRSR